MIDFTQFPSPCYIMEEELLRKNLSLIKNVADRAGVEIILAFKSFAMWRSFPIFREYKLVKIDNLERLKKKVDILDNGDQLKIVYVPGTNKTTCNYVDKIRTEEIGSGLLFSS